MASFYKVVNRFGDYTLDAQDGLLVEELLLTGKAFTHSFGELLQNNRRTDLLNNKLFENQNGVSEMFGVAMMELEASNAELRLFIRIVQGASPVVSIMLAGWLL